MRFQVTRISNYGKDPVFPGAYKDGEYWYVEITTLEQLFSQLGKNTDPNHEKNSAWEEQGLILGFPHWKTGIPQLEIYDDWRE